LGECLGRLFNAFRAAVKEAGCGDPYIVVMDFSPKHGKRIVEIIGGDAISSYATSGTMNGATPYAMLASRAAGFWDDCLDTGAAVAPIAMAGWDRRPRIEHPVPWEKNQKPGDGVENFYVMPSPAELAAHIESAMRWATVNAAQCPAQAVIVYAWNEHDEGGFLCPTLNPDGSANTSRLDAIAAMLKNFTPASSSLPRDGLNFHLDAQDAESVVLSGGTVSAR